MTICIAAICDMAEEDPKILLCIDTMKSGPLGNAETMLKARLLNDSWVVSVSGGDDIVPIVRLLKDKFLTMQIEGDVIDETNVSAIVTAVLAARKKQKADEFTLGRFAISYDEFLATGKEKLPPEIYREEMARIRDMTLDAEFIISGFPDHFPVLVETDKYGRVVMREDFAVAGSGSYLAQSVLMHRQHSDVHSFERALYVVWEAKKYAENERGVGSYTNVLIQKKGGERVKSLQTVGRTWLNAKYKKLGPQNLPDEWDSLPPNSFETEE